VVNAGVFVLGILIFGFALVAPSFGLSLGTNVPLNAVSNSSTIVSVSNPVLPACTFEPGTSPSLYSCVYSLTVTNNRESQTPLTVWWAYCIPSTCPLTTTQTANVPEGQSMTVSLQSYAACNITPGTPGCFINVPAGSYTLAVFTENSAGTPDSNTLTTNMCVPGPCQITTTTTSSTSTSTSSPNSFSIYYPYDVTLTSISPPGSGITTCTASCSNGLASYTASWTPETSLSVAFTFNAQEYNVCWEYDTGGTCTPITSGSDFTIQSEASPHYAILLPTTSTSQPVTITTCVAAPNPCDSSGLLGSWSPASATLSTSSSAATFVFAPASGYVCSGDWYLVSVQAGDLEIDSGVGALAGVTFTWSQFQTWESSYGTAFELISGTSSGGGCNAQTSTYAVSGLGAVTELSGPGCTSDSCSGIIVGPETLTFLAFCGSSTVCQSVTWTVNGIVDSAGSQYELNLQVSTSQPYVIVAYGSTAIATTTSTSAISSSATMSSSATTSSSGFGSITLQQGLEGLGAIVAVVGLGMPGSKSATKK